MSASIQHVEIAGTGNLVCPVNVTEMRIGLKIKTVPKIQAVFASFFKRSLVTITL